jgi:poly [ADP-ribose] polymerase
MARGDGLMSVLCFSDAYVEKSNQPDTDDEAEDDDEDVEMGQAGPSTKGKKKTSPSADKPVPESNLAKPVQNLLGLLFSQQYQQEALLSLNYDTEKMPLGKLSKGTISRGFQALKDLAAIINANAVVNVQQTEPLSNRYYSLIPHTFGRNRPPVINTHERLKQEIELLESLSDMKEANEMFKEANREIENNHLSQLDRQYETLGMDEMEPVDGKSAEWKELVDYLVKTKGDTHHLDYNVQDIFRIQRKGESERFDASPFAKVATSNRRLLWHGSRVTNFAGILSQGLRIAPPEAPVSGYMFGKGIYLADMSSKSANYCASGQSGGTALLLLCEAELGDPVLELTDSSYTAGEDALAQGMSSTWGKGRVGPKVWKDAGCVHPSLAGTSMVRDEQVLFSGL